MIETPSLKNKYEHILLESIHFHEKFKLSSEICATANYMLPSTDIVTEQAMRLFLLIHPVTAIKSKTEGRYECVGGMRSLLLAKSSLPLNQKIPAVILNRARKDEINTLIIADIFLTPLMLSLCNPSPIGQIYNQFQLDSTFKSLLDKSAQSKVNLAKRMGYSKNTVFPNKHSNIRTNDAHAIILDTTLDKAT